MKRLFIFAAYDKDNIIDDYVVYFVKELARLGDVIFFSDCNLPDEELVKVKPYTVYRVGERHGESGDFGSYKRGFLYAQKNHLLSRYDWLIFCNDSVFGPFYDLQPIFERMERDNDDIWGFTKNTRSGIVHIQSYFVALSSKVFSHPRIGRFFRSIEKQRRKLIVSLYENGLSKLFSDLGFEFNSFYPDDVRFKKDPKKGKYLKMIKEGFPFLKRDLFARNKHHVPHLYKYKKIKRVVPTYPFNYIEDNINRVIEKDVLKKNLHLKRQYKRSAKSLINSLLRFFFFGKLRDFLERKLRKWKNARIPSPFNPGTDYFVILCMQRSGSHMLASMLESHPKVVSHGEHIHKKLPLELDENKLNCFIIMYNQLEDCMDAGIKLEGKRIIHLTRDSTNNALSIIRNRKSSRELGPLHKSHFKDNSDIPVQYAYMPTTHEIKKHQLKISRLKKQALNIVPINDILEVTYESICGDKSVKEMPEEIRKKLLTFLDLDDHRLTTKLIKNVYKGPLDNVKSA